MALAIIFLLLIINGLFAMSEIAVVSARKARLQQFANEGKTGAATALQMADDPSNFLSTVQVGITLVGILSGAFGEATISGAVQTWLERIPAVAPYASALSTFLVVLLITYLSLVVGELVPKRLGLNDPERVAMAVAQPMRVLSTIVSPVVRLLSISTDIVVRLLGAKPPEGPPITEDEINVLMAQGAQAGVFEETEQDIVRSMFRLGDREVRGLMTPRPEIVWLDLDDMSEENRRKLATAPQSRFPVARGDLDNVLGILHTKDLLGPALSGEAIDLAAFLKPPLFVAETMHALELLERFKETGVHMALIVDEYGSIQGLVTLNDILQGIVGDMPSAGQQQEPFAVQRDDGSWLFDGLLSTDELKDLLDIDTLPGEERGDYQTLGGFVMMQLGRIPTAGDGFEWDQWRFEVMDMDGRRVDRVLASPVKAEDEDGKTS